jgi:hypothetical protein
MSEDRPCRFESVEIIYAGTPIGLNRHLDDAYDTRTCAVCHSLIGYGKWGIRLTDNVLIHAFDCR